MLSFPPHDDDHRNASLERAPFPPGEGPRALRSRRVSPSRRERPDLGVRRRAFARDPRQGQDPDPTLDLLVPEVRRRREPPPRNRRGALPGGASGRRASAGRAVGDRQEVRGHPVRVRGPRVPRRLGLVGVQEDGPGLRHRPPVRTARSGPAARADLHAGHEGRDRARREHLLRDDGRGSSPKAKPSACAT